jgi:SOS-response transcriptional repressor LexA
MTTLGKRLRRARKNKGLSQKALAERIGIKQQAVQRIERGDVKNSCYIVELAHALEVSSDWLVTGKEWRPPITYTSELQNRYTPALIKQAPLLSWQDIDEMRNLSFTLQNRSIIPIFNDHGDKCFVLELKDDSMCSPKNDLISFLQKDLLFVQVDRVPLPNEFVIARLAATNEIICRRYVCDDDNHAFLIPLNAAYASIRVTPEIEIIGVVFMRYTQLN